MHEDFEPCRDSISTLSLAVRDLVNKLDLLVSNC